jgi:hypothetical protein
MGGQQSMPKREQTMKGDIARILFAALVAVLAFNISGHASAQPEKTIGAPQDRG